MPVHAIFGITNDGLNLAVSLAILFLVIIWLALVFWTWSDARRRIEDPLIYGCATATSLLFPFVGTIVYMIVRPPEFIEDVRERELEIQAAEARLHRLGYFLCPHCEHEVENDFLRCPNCQRKLKDPCPRCSRPLDPDWTVCPYCEMDLSAGVAAEPEPALASQRRSRRRRELSADAKGGGGRAGSDGARQPPPGLRKGRSGESQRESQRASRADVASARSGRSRTPPGG